MECAFASRLDAAPHLFDGTLHKTEEPPNDQIARYRGRASATVPAPLFGFNLNKALERSEDDENDRCEHLEPTDEKLRRAKRVAEKEVLAAEREASSSPRLASPHLINEELVQVFIGETAYGSTGFQTTVK